MATFNFPAWEGIWMKDATKEGGISQVNYWNSEMYNKLHKLISHWYELYFLCVSTFVTYMLGK
jgi:hypothetical protein